MVGRDIQMTATKRDKEDASRRTFDRWAGVFDRSLILKRLRSQALREVGELNTDDRFLDVGCGAGRLVLEAERRVSRAVGLDLAPKMIERARERAEKSGARAEFHVGSVQEMPFGDGEFTVVTCTTAFHHFPDPAAAVKEIARVLAPGGRVLVGDAVANTPPAAVADAFLRRVEPGHVGLQTTSGFERLLSDAGLRVVRTRRTFARTYALVLATKPRD
jgi:ubiquinone/menaquinone biosynthesis C-methylase UbiE